MDYSRNTLEVIGDLKSVGNATETEAKRELVAICLISLPLLALSSSVYRVLISFTCGGLNMHASFITHTAKVNANTFMTGRLPRTFFESIIVEQTV